MPPIVAACGCRRVAERGCVAEPRSDRQSPDQDSHRLRFSARAYVAQPPQCLSIGIRGPAQRCAARHASAGGYCETHVDLCVRLAWRGAALVPAQALASPSAGYVPAGARHATAPGVNFQRLGDTTYSIKGHVLDYAGNGVAGAEVGLGLGGAAPPTITMVAPTSIPHPRAPIAAAPSRSPMSPVDIRRGKPTDDLTVYYLPTSPGLWELRCSDLDFATDNDTRRSPTATRCSPAQVNVDIVTRRRG